MDIESLQAICNKFPGVTEDIKWENHLCFSIAGKMFCIASLEVPLTCSLKVKDEDFESIKQSLIDIVNYWLKSQTPE